MAENGAEPASTPAHLMTSLKEDVYLIERRVSRGSTFYLTRDGSDVKAAPLSTKMSTSQIVSPFSSKLVSFVLHLLRLIQWNIKPNPQVAGLYTMSLSPVPKSLTIR